VCLAAVLVTSLLLAAEPGPRQWFKRGRSAEQAGRYAEAFQAYSEAARLDPKNAEYLTRREVVRQREAFRLVREGTQLVTRGEYAEAAKSFAAAADIDPSNAYAMQQRDRARERAAAPQGPAADLPPETAMVELQPRPIQRSWELRGDTKALYLAVGAAYGIQMVFEDEVSSVTTRLSLEESDFETVIGVLGVLTKTFVAPLDERTALVAPENNVKRLQYERQVLRHFDVRDLGSDEQINELANLLRVILEARWIAPSMQRKVIAMRDTTRKVFQAQMIVDALLNARPEVMIELEGVEVSAARARQLGLITDSVATFVKLAATGGTSPLIQAGVAIPLREAFGRKPPTTGAQSDTSIAAFGAGRTTIGFNMPGANFRALLAESSLRALNKVNLRAAHGAPAVLKFGTRFPIVSATFSPIFLSNQPQLTVSAIRLDFAAQVGGADPAPQTLAVQTLGTTDPVNFAVAVQTADGGSWLTVTPLSGTSPQTLTAAVSVAGLAAGTYSANIVITSGQIANSPLTVPVTLVVSPPGRTAATAAASTPAPPSFSLRRGMAAASAARQAQQVQQVQTGLVNPFPAFTYEDLGVNVKATAYVHGDDDVTLVLEVQTRSLSGQAYNGLPGIASREYSTQIRIASGQTAILSGVLTNEERRSLAGIPGLAELPGLGLVFGQEAKDNADSEVLLLITPRVLRTHTYGREKAE
jgi:Flp pilus assembly secretin CpaC